MQVLFVDSHKGVERRNLWIYSSFMITTRQPREGDYQRLRHLGHARDRDRWAVHHCPIHDLKAKQ
jgi:hypothetical protein